MSETAKENGTFSANEIKMFRLMVTNDFDVIRRIKVSGESLIKILEFSRIVSKM